MSKPDLNDAPEWAKYLAKDGYGTWYWFELEPYPNYNQWGVDSGDFAEAILNDVDLESNVCWLDTFEKKP